MWTLRSLREEVSSVRRERDDLAKGVALISAAVRELTGLYRPDDVIHAALRIAAKLISPDGTDGRRALFFRVDGDLARVVAQLDESDRAVPQTPIRLADHPALASVVAARAPVHTTLTASELGPTARDAVQASGITHGAAVPIIINGELVGVLAVGGRNKPIAEFDRLVDLGSVIELALANARMTQNLADLANSDPLTGCLNRRGLTLAAQTLSDREPFAVVVADLDGLKEINDRQGHECGDAALREFSDVVRTVLRTGDSFARAGGDEFVLLIRRCNATGAVRLAQRILTTLTRSSDLRVSFGAASAHEPSRFDETFLRADQAMFEAKRDGGMRCVAAEPAVPKPHTAI